MSTGDLPPWPVLREVHSGYSEEYTEAELDYERALATAAIARLRKAVEAAAEVCRDDYGEDDVEFYAALARLREALSLIGDIPDERS